MRRRALMGQRTRASIEQRLTVTACRDEHKAVNCGRRSRNGCCKALLKGQPGTIRSGRAPVSAMRTPISDNATRLHVADEDSIGVGKSAKIFLTLLIFKIKNAGEHH
jgi:hypothetical protein